MNVGGGQLLETFEVGVLVAFPVAAFMNEEGLVLVWFANLSGYLTRVGGTRAHTEVAAVGAVHSDGILLGLRKSVQLACRIINSLHHRPWNAMIDYGEKPCFFKSFS